MGVLDFLFEGKPPPSVTTYGTSTESMPAWMSDYVKGVVSRANSVAGEGYQPYGGPRIAGFTPDQQGAFNLTRQNVGSYIPGMDLASSFEEQAGSASGYGAASPFLQSAGRTFPQAVSEYMNPYEEDVINKAKLDATRYYDEELSPQLSKQFTAAGQYGSSQHEREALRAADKLAQGIQATSLAARAKGFDTAGTLFGQDASRMGTLAQVAGELTGRDAQTRALAGSNLADIARIRSGLGAADAAALSTIGAQQQGLNQKNLDLAYSDFEDQRDYDRQQVDWLNSIVRGLPYDKTKTDTNQGPLADSQYQPSNLASILSLISAVKGMGTDDNGDFAWGNIFGGGGGDIPTGEETDGSADGGLIYADGGRVNTDALDEMMALLRAKGRELDFDYVDWE